MSSNATVVLGAVTSGDGVVVAVVVAAALVVVSGLRQGLRRLFRALARRGLNGKGTRWRLRAPRLFGESTEVAELRRMQRIDATATMTARLVAAVVWTVATLVVLHVLEIDAVFVLSGAGFLGVALAIGGQNSVADFLEGLHVLWEDRFGEGDVLQIEVHDATTTATVVVVGAFSTRLETEAATVHVPNRTLAPVVNLSQRGVTTELEFTVASGRAARDREVIESLLRAVYAAGEGFDASRDGLVVDRIERDHDERTVVLRTARPLGEDQRAALIAAVTVG